MRRWLPLRLPLALPLAAAATLIRRLSERVNLPIDEVAIVFAIGVISAQLQRRIVRLHRLGPFLNGLLRSEFLQLLARTIERIAEVEVSILLVCQALCVARRRNLDRLLEGLRCLGKLSRSIGGRTRVVLQDGCPPPGLPITSARTLSVATDNAGCKFSAACKSNHAS